MLRSVARDSRRARTMPLQIALHERDPGALQRHVRARPHRDADRRLRQRRRVVDPVARHRHQMAAPAAVPRSTFRLSCRQHLGAHIVDAQASGDRARRSSGYRRSA